MATYRDENQRRRVEEMARRNGINVPTGSSDDGGQSEVYRNPIFRSADQQRRVEGMLERQGFSVDKIWSAYNDRAQKKWEQTVYDAFPDEDDYNTAVRYSGYHQKYNGQTYSQIQDALSKMEDGEEKEWLTKYAPQTMSDRDFGVQAAQYNTDIYYAQKYLDEYKTLADAYGVSGQEEDERILSQIQALSEKYGFKNKQEAENALKQLEKEKQDLDQKRAVGSHSVISGYDSLMENGDFSLSATSGWQKYLRDQESQAETKTAEKEWLSRPHFGVSGLEMASMGLAVDDSYKLPSDQWTMEEKGVYGYLYGLDQEKAEQFAIATNNYYNGNEQNAQFENVEQFANDHPVASTVGGIFSGAAGLGMADFLTAGIEKFARGTNTQRSFVSPHQAAETATGTVAKNLNDKHGTISESVPVLGGHGLGDAYQLLNSIITSSIAANTVGTIGTDVVFFGNAAASAMDDARSRGASDEQALLMALISGSAEAAGEHFSTSHLLEMADSRTIKQFFGTMFGQALEEGEEELFTSFVNNLADNYIMQDKSNFNRDVEAYKQNNPDATDEEAKKAVWKQMWYDMAFDFLGGFASGGVHTAGQTALNRIESNANYHSIYGGSAAELVQEGLRSPEGTDSRALAEKFQKKLDGGKELSGSDLRRLVQANEQQIRTESLETDGFYVGQNSEKGTSEITFAEKPSVTAQATLKENGFKWSKKGNVWYGDVSQDQARNIALNALGKTETSDMQASESADGTKNDSSARNTLNTESKTAKNDFVRQSPVEDKPFELSNLTGKTLLNLSDGSTVETEITGIASTEKGKLMLNVTGQSQPVKASSISYASTADATLYNAINSMEISPEDAKRFVNLAHSSGDTTGDFAVGIQQMYILGKSGVPISKAMNSRYGAKLSDTNKRFGYGLGRALYNAQVQKAEAEKKNVAASQRARAATGGTKVNGVQYDGLTVSRGKDGSVVIEGVNLNAQQKAGIQAAEMLAGMGVNIHVFQSRTDANGEPIGENGSYHLRDGSIHIDLNAGNLGQGVMVYTIAHEFTHFMEQQSPAKFQAFTDALFAELDIDVEAEIERKAKELKRKHPEQYKNASRDTLLEDARSEVVAEACETMLTDTDAAQRIGKTLQAKDATLFEKVKQWFRDLADKLRRAYNGLNPDSQIAQYAKKTIQQVDGLVQLWADMAVDAAENYRGAVAKDAGITSDDSMYSIRRTSNMSWGQQIRSALKHNGKIQHMDTLVVMNNTPAYLLTGNTVNLPMAIPLSVITKAQNGKNADHAISDKTLIALQYGMENAIAVIDNPGRNSLAFITSLEEDGGKVAVFFDKNVQFDGDQVNKATSIHRRTNIVGLMNNLSDDATIYVKNKNEFDALVGMADSIPAAYKGKIKFVDDRISQEDNSVKLFSDRYSEENSGSYSYESLVSKPDMVVTLIEDKFPKSRADVVFYAKKNASKIGKFNTKDGSVSVHVKDIGRDVVLSTAGLKHSLDRRFDVNAPVTLMAGSILQNSIKLNEMTAQHPNAENSYILVGAAENSKGQLYIVRSVVNRFSNEVTSMDVLYAFNAKTEPDLSIKKETGRETIPNGSRQSTATITGSTISISELLDYVNEYFPEILPEDVLKHYGHNARPAGKLGESALYSERGGQQGDYKEELVKTRAQMEQDAKNERDNFIKEYQAQRKSSVENWRRTEVDTLRKATEFTEELGLSVKEKTNLDLFRRNLDKLDSIQAKYEEIRNKDGVLREDDLGKLSRYQKQMDTIHKNLWEYSQYPILKSVSKKTRELLSEKYGTIPEGENPARAAGIPTRTNEDNRVSRTVRTAIEAAATTDEAAELIQQKVVEGEFSYLPITDDASNKRAEETLRKKGWDDALSDWRGDMRKTAFPGKDMVALGFRLYNNAVNTGDTKTAIQILTDITNTVRNSAQVVQAVRILKQLSPENRLYAIKRQIDSLQDELNKRYGEKAPQIDMNSALTENYINANGEEAIRAAEEALFRDIAAKLPNTFADKWNSWRYLSMLGNLRTHVRNVLGNVGFAPVRATKDLIAYGIESGINAISKDGIARTKGVLSPVSKSDRALYSAGLSDYAIAEDLLGSANVKSGDSISRIERMRPAFGGDNAVWRALSKVAEMNSNALSVEDMLFKKTTYAAAFGGFLKANGITAEMLQSGKAADGVLDEARVYAFEEALKATYNDFNDFSNFISKVGSWRYSKNDVKKVAGHLAEGVLPFKRTPANIVSRAVEYSPIGLMTGIKQSLFGVRRGNVTAAEAIDSIASGLTGTVLLGLGALLASMGLVSGGDDEDDKQRQFDKLRGEQSYAINVFGKSYTIDWLAPEVIPMFVGVELYNSVNSDGSLQFKDILDSFARVTKPLLEMSCLQSLNDLLDSISYSESKLYSILAQASASYVLQAIPTVFGQIERIGETEREQTYIDNSSQLPKDFQYTIAKAANKIPGVEFEQIPYIDAYGRRQETGNIGTRMFSNLLSPGYLSSDRSAPWDDELQRLYDLGYSSVLPSQAAKKIGDRELSAEEYVRYATYTGQERYRLLGEVTESDYYAQRSDADKEDILKDLYTYVNAKGSKLMIPDREIARWTEKAMEMEKLGYSFTDFLKMKNEAVNENGNFTKDVCVSYIEEHFPKSKWKAVWDIMKDSNWKDVW